MDDDASLQEFMRTRAQLDAVMRDVKALEQLDLRARGKQPELEAGSKGKTASQPVRDLSSSVSRHKQSYVIGDAADHDCQECWCR